jgi:hypothetical protein
LSYILYIYTQIDDCTLYVRGNVLSMRKRGGVGEEGVGEEVLEEKGAEEKGSGRRDRMW